MPARKGPKKVTRCSLELKRERVTTRVSLAVATLAFGFFVGAASADELASIERMSFKVADAFEPGAAVSGELRIPRTKDVRLPAVLILHGSAGVDGRGRFYADALNEAGIATLEIDLFNGRGRPQTTRHNMPHVYETLQYLARHPKIDPERIGIMGFSWGGILSLLTSSDELTRQYAGGKLRFAAHLGIYPVCWAHRTVLAGTAKYFKPSVYQQVTGSPVHILAGGKDDYDDTDTCQMFLSELPADVRSHFSLTTYPEGTHGWDSRAGGAYHDVAAHQGRGGPVQVIANSDIANQSRSFAVTYFRKHLSTDR